MSGLPHPVTHITEWREDGVATVMWCGSKFLFDDPLVLEAGETKPCPVCGIELHHDEKKKGVVENPKLSLTEAGGQMAAYHEVRDALCKLRAGAHGNISMDGKGPRVLTDAAAFDIAPIIVKFGRAAWGEGYDNALDFMTNSASNKDDNSDSGITAGVAAMAEGP